MRRLPVLAIAAALALAGCSASGGDDAATTTTAAEETTTTAEAEEPTTTVDEDVAELTEDDYVEAFTEQLTSGAGSNLALDDEAGECVAVAWVDAIGLEVLRESGATVEDIADPDFDISAEVDIDDETGAAVAQAFPDCDADLIPEFATVIASDEESAQCVIDAIDPDEFYEVLGETFASGDGDPLDALLTGAASSCGIDF